MMVALATSFNSPFTWCRRVHLVSPCEEHACRALEMQDKGKLDELICVEPTTLSYHEGVELGYCRDTADSLRHRVGVGAAWRGAGRRILRKRRRRGVDRRIIRTGGGDDTVLTDEVTDTMLAVLPPKLGTGHGPCRTPSIQPITEVTMVGR